ncbi:hypothetical protein GCM10027040_27330 [Halomonas shantousis]
MSDAISVGYEVGETCNRHGCQGVIQEIDPDGCCSCHISPPCGYCTAPREHCPECEWRLEDDETTFNDFRVGPVKLDGAWTHYRPRPLNPSKIDWRSKSHTHSSMIKEGVYPQSVDDDKDRAAVLKEVEGTFGGRFKHFGNGRFEYIAYTD